VAFECNFGTTAQRTEVDLRQSSALPVQPDVALSALDRVDATSLQHNDLKTEHGQDMSSCLLSLYMCRLRLRLGYIRPFTVCMVSFTYTDLGNTEHCYGHFS